MADALWATPEDIYNITRTEVEEDVIAVAQEIVALEAGVNPELDLDPDSTAISSQNRRLLVRALAWQAAWLPDHPDALSAMDVTGVSQDGLSATYAAQNAAFLAPLAARCIRRLSWRKAALRVRHGARRPLDVGNRDNAERDDSFPWTPMGASGQLGGNVRFGQVWSG